MARALSPLRYPGGKLKIYDKVKTLIETNSLGSKTYIEPFAGGFGLGIGLLSENIIQKAVLNDFDSHIYNFWYSVLNHTEDLVKMIKDTPINIEERDRQKEIYKDNSAGVVKDGFATLFLNRVNFSGVINGGPIGGLSQCGVYKLDCRFNKNEIAKRIETIALLKERIRLYNYDACELITDHLCDDISESFFNIDPPYVKNGHRLYANFFKEEDHRNLEKIISKYLSKTSWIVTYDDCSLIRDIYKQYHMVGYYIQHNAGVCIQGKEVVITNIPRNLFVW